MAEYVDYLNRMIRDEITEEIAVTALTIFHVLSNIMCFLNGKYSQYMFTK